MCLMCYVISPVFNSKTIIYYRSLSNQSVSSPSLYSSLSAAASARTLTPDSSIPSCFHRLQATQAPELCTVFSQRSRISSSAMYCVTVFCLFNI